MKTLTPMSLETDMDYFPVGTKVVVTHEDFKGERGVITDTPADYDDNWYAIRSVNYGFMLLSDDEFAIVTP